MIQHDSGDQPLVGLRVLVVEDNFPMALLVQRALESAGAQVVGPFPSLARTFDALADNAPDCAVLDVNLDIEDVYPLADHLQSGSVPFLLASGYDDSHFPERFANCPRLEKPYDIDRLINAVRALRRSAN
ncbi:MAG TPA: response regulator [Phycisphaerae bacterium]|nr:response regulator [Phycisphaerales bacterium]HRX84246.1 response regulator [Phycisphaerae bacterium]